MIAEQALNFTSYPSANRGLLRDMGVAEDEFLAAVKQLGENTTEAGQWHRILVNEMTGITRAVCLGELGPDVAVERACGKIAANWPEKVGG